MGQFTCIQDLCRIRLWLTPFRVCDCCTCKRIKVHCEVLHISFIGIIKAVFAMQLFKVFPQNWLMCKNHVTIVTLMGLISTVKVYSVLRGRACVLEKCSSAASFSSAAASCSPLCFLEARRAWRKTSTCGRQAQVLEGTPAAQSCQKPGLSWVLYWKLGVGGRRGGGTILEQPQRPESSDLGLPKGLLHLLQEFQLMLSLFQVAV